MDIYDPAEDSYLLQKYVRKHAQGRVLDLGTGLGIQALTAAENISVREILAVDINEDALINLRTIINSKKVRKIKLLVSDLFSNVSGKFDMIVFNPPYLPQDKGIEDLTIYGGKKGYELSEKFFAQVSRHLTAAGKILFLFSSFTNKKKIDEIIEDNLLEAEQLERQHFNFEDLFVYLITKTALLKELERKGIESIHYFTHGKRGNIYTGFWNNNISAKKILTKKIIKVAIKTKRQDSKAQEIIKNEVRWLKILNKKNIGPRLLFSGKNYFVYEFVSGNFIIYWIKNNKKVKIKKMLLKILEQCFILDKLKVNKKELHRPLKHILINKFNRPVFLDFERAAKTEKPKNVTQFVEFLVRLKFLERKKVLPLLKEYKTDYSQKNLEKIIKCLS